MATTATPTPATLQSIPSPREQFLDAFQKEVATTLRVLRAYPPEELDLKPHAKCKTARDLAWIFVGEMGMAKVALTTGFDWSQPMPSFPPAPESLEAIIAALDESHQGVVQLVRDLPDDQLFRPVAFPVGPKQMGEYPLTQFLWFMLCDHIHHRGQFSVYLRMADGKVPSIYGPTLDEPWM